MPGENATVAHGKKFVQRLAHGFGECKQQSAAYGACLKLHYEGVQRGACEKDFQALQQCFTTSLAKARR